MELENNIKSNNVQESATGIITLSGFGSDMMSDTVGLLLSWLEEKGVKAYTFPKRGHKEDPHSHFSISWVQQDISQLTESIGKNHDTLVYVGNSMTSLSFLESMNEYNEKVSQTLLLSPVFSPEITIKKWLEIAWFLGIEDINKWLIDAIERYKNVHIDTDTFIQELKKYSQREERENVIKWQWKKIHAFVNPEDPIIYPPLVQELSETFGFTITETPSVNNKDNHAIPVDEVLKYL